MCTGGNVIWIGNLCGLSPTQPLTLNRFSDLAVRFVTISGISKEARANPRKADCASKQLSVRASMSDRFPSILCPPRRSSRAQIRNSLINLGGTVKRYDFELGKCPSSQWHRNPLNITILSQRTHQFSLVLRAAQRLEIILSTRPAVLTICRRFI